MKKCLLFVAASIFLLVNGLNAQTTFMAPDSLCVGQAVHVNSRVFGADSYYWGFCSGNIHNAPTGTNMGSGFNFHTPGGIDIVRDVDSLYYGFVLNTSTRELLRLNYGSSLSNTPSVTNFGSLTDGLPVHPTGLTIVRDSADSKWFIFVTGGYTLTESTVGRVDFGGLLSNPTPNVANFGNMLSMFNGPRGIFVAKDTSGNWHGYLVNRTTSELIRLDFGTNISTTPTPSNLGNVGGLLNTPTDMAAIKDLGNWHLFVTNFGNDHIIRIDLGPTLNTSLATSADLGDFNFRVLRPSSITMTRDCQNIYAYITDSTTSQLVQLAMPTALGIYTPTTYSVVGGMNFPASISSIIRDRDDLYAFITNAGDSSLTRIDISHCTNSSIPSFTEVSPPVYYYNTPGLYTIYFVVNDGKPDMTVECKDIRVLPIPNISINTDTLICPGDTIKLYAVSNFANVVSWSPDYNADTTYNNTDSIKVWPGYSTQYNVQLTYPDGCVVDTNIFVAVSKVKADAGPDRTIADGSTTTLGGPYTTLDGVYSYQWTPNLYLSASKNAFVTANPPSSFTYYLEVTEFNDRLGCKSMDTVVVTVTCGDVYLPNAFVPTSSNGATNKFGLLNNMITQLNYFRIYDRWGNVVFTTSNPAQQWDGTVAGKNAPVGVYIWEVNGFCSSGKPVQKKGNVSLLK